MYTAEDPDVYRNNILKYFKKKDKQIYNILIDKISDWRFPFKSIYNIYEANDEKIDIMAFIGSAIIFNTNKLPIRKKASFRLPEKRGDVFLQNIIEEKRLNHLIVSLSTSIYIASQMLNKIKKDVNFEWVIKNNIDSKYSDTGFIFVDTSNVHMTIKNYTGKNRSIIKFRDKIIRNRGLNECLTDLIEYMKYDLNKNSYRYIFMTPGKYYDVSNDSFIVSINCNDYIGTKCGKETFSNEVDDALLIMLYDYCKFKYGINASILSGDNFDFSIITQDYSNPIERSVFSMDDDSIIMNWEEIQYIYPGLSFNSENRLTIFEENFVY